MIKSPSTQRTATRIPLRRPLLNNLRPVVEQRLRLIEADGSVRLLVQIPGTNAPRFRELVTGKPAPAATAAPEQSQLIEVIVTK